MADPKERPRQPRFSFPNLHDWYAGEAMKALLIQYPNLDRTQVAADSFTIADAMLEERTRRRTAGAGPKDTKSVGSFNL